MQIDHIAIYTYQLESLRNFYSKFFGATSSNKYQNLKNGFESYFLTFETGCRLELMHMASIPITTNNPLSQATGITHLAFKVGSQDIVREKTKEFRKNGIWVVREPRMTGDGYFECVILDPDGNRIEIIA